ncbi:MAG: 50S ribosomal protein L9 [Omnitrophica bacterium RIFCSPHIGHO2_02_FULL_51_18]|nr:MAG: 50S ribosomal protein L9 [Omnitrophica bacterium RIFCSPHIGHO2_02_FULL_51_18]
MNVEVILTQDDPKLGRRGRVVKVSSGFAQNFLIPQGKAKLATASLLKNFEEEQKRREKEKAETLANARKTAQSISERSLTIEVKVGEGEKLYGAVTSHHIQEGLAKHGIVIDKRDVHLAEPIKKLGAYQIEIKVHPEVIAKLKVWVVAGGVSR